MGKFSASAADIAIGTILKPSWYEATVSKVEDTTDKNGNDMVWVTFNLSDARDHEDSPVPNASVRTNFGLAYPIGRRNAVVFLRALGETIGKDGKEDLEITEEKHKGLSLKVYVVNGQYEGSTNNQVKDFRPLG